MGAHYRAVQGDLDASMASEKDWASLEVHQLGFEGIEVFVTAPAYHGISSEDDLSEAEKPATYLVMIRMAGGGPEIASAEILADTLEVLDVRRY